MTKEEILAAAKEAGFDYVYALIFKEDLHNFAALIEKRTIERCAAVCEKEADQMVDGSCTAYSLKECSAAIRALGEQ